MRILITGTLGYVGPAVISHLRTQYPTAELIGYDCGLFARCLTTLGPAPETKLNNQRFADVRDVRVDDMRGIDVVVHLAAISNDPVGNRFEEVTDAINRAASLRLAECARDAGVKRFVFASSCSVYGYAEAGARRETDRTEPLTAYARSKVSVENGLAQMDLGGMEVTCLRFATACGFSERLRLDLVLNDFVACALTSKRITVLSDGTPWRPLIDVRDMARAIDWAISRERERGGQMLVLNVGSSQRNHQVRDLANAVAEAVPSTVVDINADAPPDARSYRVDFGLFHELAPEHQPRVNLTESINNLVAGMDDIGFSDTNFRVSTCMTRLGMVSSLVATKQVSSDLRWAWSMSGGASHPF